MTRYKDRFHQAARDGYLDLLRDASRRECDAPDEDGMSPVMWAAFYGNLDALRLLISRGGNPDKTNSMGNTALHAAAANGHMNCVTYLVNFGANIWILDNDFHTALDVASLRDHKDIVEFLDTIASKQFALNRRVVTKLRERASLDAQKRCKKYEKMLSKASKKLSKPRSKKLSELHIHVPDGSASSVSMRNPQSRGINSLQAERRHSSPFESAEPVVYNNNGTLLHHQSGEDLIIPHSQQHHHSSSKVYSDYITSSRKNFKFNVGGARKIINRRQHNSDIDERRSLSALPPDTDVAYAFAKNYDGKSIRSGPTSEPDFSVLAGGGHHYREDSGFSSSHSAGLFERPGFGSVAFFHRPRTMETLNSYALSSDSSSTLQASPAKTSKMSYSDSIGTSRSLIMRRWRDLPWSEEDVQALDDDTIVESSDVELFLACLGLTDYMPLFNKEQMDLDALLLCTDADLQTLGLPLGPRKKIIEAINRRREAHDCSQSLQDLKL